LCFLRHSDRFFPFSYLRTKAAIYFQKVRHSKAGDFLRGNSGTMVPRDPLARVSAGTGAPSAPVPLFP
jgi:hypothetical protein